MSGLIPIQPTWEKTSPSRCILPGPGLVYMMRSSNLVSIQLEPALLDHTSDLRIVARDQNADDWACDADSDLEEETQLESVEKELSNRCVCFEADSRP